MSTLNVSVNRLPSAAPVPAGTCVFGAAAVDVTPTPGLAMAGYSLAGKVSRGAYGRLTARAFYLRDARGEAAAVCVVDLLAGARYVCERVGRIAAKEVGLSVDRLVVCGTHAHTAPGHCFGNTLYDGFAQAEVGFDRDWADWLSRRVADAVRDAAAVPANVVFARPAVWAAARNRSLDAFRNCVEAVTWNRPGMPGADPPPGLTPEQAAVDPRLTVMAGTDATTGRLIGAFATFACHPTSMGSGCELYCPDWPGIARRVAAAGLAGTDGRRPVVAVAPGSTGDASPMRPAPEQGSELAHLVGRQVGEALAAAARAAAASAVPFTLDVWFAEPAAAGNGVGDPGSPARRQTQLADAWAYGAPTVGGAEDGPSVLSTLGVVREGMTDTDFPPGSPQRPKHQGVVLDILRRLAANVNEVVPGPALPIRVLRVNDHAFAAVPGEPTAVSGWRLEQAVTGAFAAAGRPVAGCAVLGYAGDYCGYLTSPEEYDVQCYEGSSTLWGRNTIPFLAASLARLVSAAPARVAAETVAFRTIAAGNLFDLAPATGGGGPAAAVRPTASRDGPRVELLWTMPKSVRLYFAGGPVVRVQGWRDQPGQAIGWHDLLVDGAPVDDVERWMKVERSELPPDTLAGKYRWRVEMRLPDAVPPGARLRAVAPPRPGFAGFEVELPPA